jgi:O-glycosyl hydrolase
VWFSLAMPAGAQVSVNGAQTYQVINGFGANLNHRSWNGNELKPVLNTMIGQGGMTIFRVAFDNTDWLPTNNFSQSYLNSIYGSARFEKLWDLIAYLNQQGITNGIMLNFEGPGPAWMGGATLTSGDEPQWAAMIASLVTYARNTRHLQFNLVGPDNEPDNASTLTGVGANASQYTTMLSDLAQDLNSNGLSDIRLVGPDLATTSTSWMSSMMGNSLVMSNLAHFGLHSYQGDGGNSGGVSSAIGTNTFWMTEFNTQCTTCYSGIYNSNTYNWSFCSTTAQNLLAHLANGASAGLAWEGYDSYYELLPLAGLQSSTYQAAGWSFFGLFGVDNTNAVPKTYTARKNFYTMSQISAFVPPGAVRIGVNGGGSPTSSFMVLAFYHAASGRVTLTGFNTGSQMSVPITLANLPAVASFDLYHTDANTNLSHDATYAVSGGAFTATIPASCIFTLTGFDPAKIAVSVQMTSPTNGSGYNAPAAIPLRATATTTTGSISNVTYYCGTNRLGASSNPPYGFTWSGVPPGVYVVTAVATNSAGNTNMSAGVTVSVAGPAAQIMVVPTNVALLPQSRQQFTASVQDALGIPLTPQPAVEWLVGGSGTINGSGLFMAGSNVGDQFSVAAVDNEVIGIEVGNIVSGINVATNGIGYVWYNLPSSTANSQQYETPGINDGDLVDGNSLLPGTYDGTSDNPGAYEAAGVVWASPQTISNVVYINGPVSGGNGCFDAGFQLQFTTDGSTWAAAGPQWSLSPAYSYNSPAAAGVSYVFSGGLDTVMGVRCVGQLNTGRNTSTVASAAEVQAYLGAAPMLQASATTTGVMVSWNSYVTNCVLQTTTNQFPPFTWTTVTNARQYSGSAVSVLANAPAEVGYFRLMFP